MRDYITLVEHKESYKSQLLSTVYATPIAESILLEDFGLGDLWDGLKKLVGDAATWLWDKIKALISSVTNMLPDVPKYIFHGAVDFIMWCAVNPLKTLLGVFALKFPSISSEAIKNVSALITHAFGGDAGARGQLAMGGLQGLIGSRTGIPFLGTLGFLDGAKSNFRDPEYEGKVWSTVLDAMETINNWVQDIITPEAIESIAKFAVRFAIPVAVIASIIYGGQLLYDYMSKNDPPKSTEEKLSLTISKDAEPKTATESMRSIINKVDLIR